jgi:hypothetical protein
MSPRMGDDECHLCGGKQILKIGNEDNKTIF